MVGAPNGVVGAPGFVAVPGLSAMVGAPIDDAPGAVGAVGAPMGAVEVARRIVGTGAPAVETPPLRSGTVGIGAPAIGGAPAARSAAVGGGVAGVDGRGAGEGKVAVGGKLGAGGLTGGAIGMAEDGMAGGLSEAFKVTRTVSFLSGTLEVCLDGGGSGGWFSLMHSQVYIFNGVSKKIFKSAVKHPARDFSEISAGWIFCWARRGNSPIPRDF